MPYFSWEGDDLLLRVRISPGASRDKVGDVMGDRLKVLITSPPVDGKANQGLCRFLAKQFGVAPSLVTLERGMTDRNKTVRIVAPAELPVAFGIERLGNG